MIRIDVPLLRNTLSNTVLLAAMLVSQVSMSAQVIRTFSGLTMGTSYYVKVVQPGQQVDWVSIEQQIKSTLNSVDERMSTYKPESELSKFNRSAANTWFLVSTETFQVIRSAVQIGRASRGAFDITIGPLVNRWGFGPGPEPSTWPEAMEIKSLMSHTGLDKLTIRSNPPSVMKSTDKVYMDLSSIAKGYAVDQVAELLLKEKLSNFMVEVGGELRTHGTRQDGRWWQIAIEKPSDQASIRAVQRVLTLKNKAIATSGNYRNFSQKNSKRAHHIVDPRTGQPANHPGLMSVSVVDDSSMTSDAWATALLVLGPKAGLEIANRHGLAALFLVVDDGKWREIHSETFRHQHATADKT